MNYPWEVSPAESFLSLNKQTDKTDRQDKTDRPDKTRQDKTDRQTDRQTYRQDITSKTRLNYELHVGGFPHREFVTGTALLAQPTHKVCILKRSYAAI